MEAVAALTAMELPSDADAPVLPRILCMTPSEQCLALSANADLLHAPPHTVPEPLKQSALTVARLVASQGVRPWTEAVRAHAQLLLDCCGGTAGTALRGGALPSTPAR